MCGIVGAFTSNQKLYKSPAIQFFKQAIFADTVRGWDSTGIAVMDEKMASPEVFKKALAGPDFLDLRHVKNMLDDTNSWSFMLGHNRAATRGAVEHDTSHPFQYGDITLVHNGTVTNHRMLTQGNRFTVDSEAICNAMNIDGIAAVVRKLQGAFTLVWHDASDNSLNIIRNEERPLWIGVVEGGETLLMCSEGAMLQWLAMRHGYKLTKTFQPGVGVAYKYYIGSSKDWANEPVVEVLPLAPKPTVYSGGTGTTTTTTNSSYNAGSVTATTLRGLGQDISPDGKHVVVFKPETIIPNSAVGSLKPTCRVTGSLVGVTQDHDVVVYGADEEEWTELLNKPVLAIVESAYATSYGSKLSTVVISKSHPFTAYETEVEAIEEKKLKVTGSATGRNDSSKKSESDSDTKNEDDPSEPRDLYKGFGRSFHTPERMENLLKHGCANCSCDLFLVDVPDIFWDNADTPLCKWCASLYDPTTRLVTH